MRSDFTLAAAQAALLELLSSDTGIDEMHQQMRERLEREPVFAPYRAHAATLEPEMVEVASLLVKKWGVRDLARTGENAFDPPRSAAPGRSGFG